MSIERKRISPFYIAWDVLDTIVGKKSAVDLPRLHCDTMDKAHDFLAQYGFDLNQPGQREEIDELLLQARTFALNELAPDPEGRQPPLQIPKEIAEEEDARQLMVMATVRSGEVQRWACTVLSVMHTITHVNNDLAGYFFQQIQEQILQRIKRFTHEEHDGTVYLGTSRFGIPLHLLEIRTRKSFTSTVLKLLHKPENTTADIFDRIGVRIVTMKKLGVIMALKFFVDRNLVAYPNIKTSRSRNTLINLEYFRQEMDKIIPLYNRGDLSAAKFRELGEMILEGEGARQVVSLKDLKNRNAFSSTAYNSIQFTARQLVRVPNPILFNFQMDQKEDVQNEANSSAPLPPNEFKFFFPFEIQILDKQSYLESRQGRASHEVYKLRQIQAIRKRLFRSLIQ